MSMTANEPLVENGWCESAQIECTLGLHTPRPCGKTRVHYLVQHGGLGCCNNAAGRVFGSQTPPPVIVNVGTPEDIVVDFDDVKCGTEQNVTLEVRCGQGVNGPLESTWIVKYRCDACTIH